MINKMFQEVVVGQRFFLDNKEYVKTQDVRISCCKTINATATNDSNDRIYVQPTSMVSINA